MSVHGTPRSLAELPQLPPLSKQQPTSFAHLPAAGRSDRAGSRLLFVCAATPAEWSPFHEVSSAQKPQRPLFRVPTYKPLVRRSIRDAYPPHMSKIHAPICPRCNQPMTWDRTIPAFGPAWPDLHSFYCDTCGHAETLAFRPTPLRRDRSEWQRTLLRRPTSTASGWCACPPCGRPQLHCEHRGGSQPSCRRHRG